MALLSVTATLVLGLDLLGRENDVSSGLDLAVVLVAFELIQKRRDVRTCCSSLLLGLTERAKRSVACAAELANASRFFGSRMG